MQEIKEEEKKDEQKEGDAEKKDEAQEEKSPEPKKKRFRKIELNITAEIGGLSEKDVNNAMEQELHMAQQDRVIEETFNKRNELESFVYEMRNQLGDKLSEYISSTDKAQLEEQLAKAEDWLYSDEGFDSTKSVYQSKLDELQKLTNPVQFRLTDSTERSIAASELTSALEEYKRMANSGDEKYSHWTQEEKEKLRSTCIETESWLFEALTKQGELSLTDTPSLTSAAIRAKLNAVRAIALPITSKPKPLPKVEVPSKSEETKPPSTDEEDSKPADEAETMDLD
jgi:heat shock protein 4